MIVVIVSKLLEQSSMQVLVENFKNNKNIFILKTSAHVTAKSV